MKESITIDKAGRVVLPKPVRDRLNLVPGSDLDIRVVNGQVVLRPCAVVQRLVRRGGLLVHEGRPLRDLVESVEQGRRDRMHQLAETLR